MERKQDSAPSSTFEFEAFAKLSVAASLSYFTVMSNVLGKDTRRCMDMCLDLKAKILPGEQPVDQESYTDLNFWYRNLIRAFVTEVEGLLFVMRRIAVWAYDRGEINMSIAEAVLARETEYRIDARRKRIEERERSNRLLENFILAFSLFPQVFRANFQINYGDQGWEAFQKVVEARNSLTHPKSPEDTLLKPDMYDTISRASAWFYSRISDLLKSVDKAYLEQSLRDAAMNPDLKSFLDRQKS